MILNNYRSKKLLQNKNINPFREIFGIKTNVLAFVMWISNKFIDVYFWIQCILIRESKGEFKTYFIN